MLEDELVRLLGTAEEYGEIEELQEEIVDYLLPNDEAEKKDKCILEVMQAAGGSESSLFAEEIVNMYKNYCRNQGHRMREETFVKDMAIHKGCKYAQYTIEGENIYRYFKHESGAHKV